MAESIVTAAPRPPAARWRRWSFRAAARCTSRATTSPTNESALSDETVRVLHRVGMAMGAAQGTGPDDDPFLRRQRRESRAQGWEQGRALGRTEGHPEGWVQGHAEGQAKGLDEGREEGMRAAVLHVFESRGITISADLSERLAEIEGDSAAALVRAAMTCRDEADFLRLIPRRSPAGSGKGGV